MLNPDAPLHSSCLLHDDARGRIDALLHILSVHPCLQSTVDSEAPGLDDGFVHLRVPLIHHQVCLPCVDICSTPPVPQVCLELLFARSIPAPSFFAARNILNGGGRLAVVHANQHSGDAPLRLPDFHRAPSLPSTPLHLLHLLGQSTHFGILLRMAPLQLLHRTTRLQRRQHNSSRLWFVSLGHEISNGISKAQHSCNGVLSMHVVTWCIPKTRKQRLEVKDSRNKVLGDSVHKTKFHI